MKQQKLGCTRTGRRAQWTALAIGAALAALVVPSSAQAVAPSSTPSWAQQFGTSGTETAQDVAVSRSGVVYSLGVTTGDLSGSGAGAADIWVARHNASGSRRWTKQFGTSGIEYAGGIAVSPTGDVYVVGSSEGSLVGTNVNTAYADAFIAKYDSNGRRKWIRQIASASGGDEFATAVAINSRGEIYVAGTTTADLAGTNTGPGSNDAWVARYDRNGNRIWIQQYGTDTYDLVNDLVVTASGGVHLVGNTEGSLPGTTANAGSSDAFLITYDRSGTHQSNLQWGSAEPDSFTGVAGGASGELYVSGWTDGTLPTQTSAGGRDAVIARIDVAPTPAVVWHHQLGSDLSDEWNDIAVRGSSVYVTGETRGSVAETSAGGYDVLTARYDTAGQRKWIDQVGSSQFDFSYSIATSSSGNLYLAVTTSGVLGTTKFGDDDAVVLKYPASRNTMWVRQLGDTGNEYFYGVAAASNGTSWSVGAIGGPGWGGADHNVDILVAKHDAAGNESFVVRLGTDQTDYASAAAAGPSGSVIVVGTTSGSLDGTNKGDYDGFVARIDATGSVLWWRQIGSIYYDGLTGVAVTSRGDIYVTGRAGASIEGLTPGGDSDVIVAKYDKNGNRKWLRQLGTVEADYGSAVGVSRTGAVYVAGATEGSFDPATPALGQRPLLVRYDSNGNRKWIRQYSTGTGAGEFSSVAVTPLGDVYAAGITNGSVETGVSMQGVRDLFVMRINRTGSVRWAHQYGTAGSDRAYGLAVTPSGTVTMVGTTEGDVGTNETFLGANPAEGDDDIVVMRFDRNGRRTALRQWGTAQYDEINAVAVTPNGTAYLAGSTAGVLGTSSAGDMDAIAIRFST